MSKSDTTLRQTMRHHNEPLRRANTTSTNLRSKTPGWDEAGYYRRRQRRRQNLAAFPRGSPWSIDCPSCQSDTSIAGIVAAAIVSLLVMIGVVWYGIGDLADVIPWHLNASGRC